MARYRFVTNCGRVLKWLFASAAVSALAACGGEGISSITTSLPDLSGLSAAFDAPSPEPADAEKKSEPKPIDMAELLKPGTLGEKTLGKPGAPVSVVVYTSLACPACASFNADTLPKLKKAYIDKGKVVYIFRDYPQGQPAAAAAIAARCVPDKDFFKVIDKFFATQKDWAQGDVNKDAIYKVVQSTAVKRDKFDACFANQSIYDALVGVKQRGTSFGVYNTPVFFINGKKVAGAISFEEMRTIIDAALAEVPAGPQARRSRPTVAPVQPTSGEKQPT